MKNILTACLMIASLTAFAQNNATNTQQNTNPPASQDRTARSSSKTQVTTAPSEPLPYDVNDKYMGRKDEFLFMTTLKELPSDFPVYAKQWGVKEYNGVIESYFMNHIDILKDNVKPKIQYLIDQQKQTK